MPNKRTGEDYLDRQKKKAHADYVKKEQKKRVKQRGGPDVGSGKLIKFNDKMKKILEKYPAPKRFNKQKRN